MPPSTSPAGDPAEVTCCVYRAQLTALGLAALVWQASESDRSRVWGLLEAITTGAEHLVDAVMLAH
jgi:hypothetical protein